jgi:hypothetical protein
MKKFSFGKIAGYVKKFENLKTPDFKKGWENIILPYYPKNGKEGNLEELKILKSKILSNTEEDLEKIAEQDSATKEFEYHFADIVGNPKEKEFIGNLAGQVFKIVLYFKNKFDRPRPWQMAKHFKFDYPDIHTETGESPSYPSGHATGAYFLAEVMSRKYPKHKKKLFDYADEVAENRMKAGVHYPSDIRAGKILASKLLNYYKDPNHLHFKEWF